MAPSARISTPSREGTRVGRALCWAMSMAFLVLVGTLLVPLQPASAHPFLVETIPQAGYATQRPPEEIGLVFDERVSVGSEAIVVDGLARGIVPTSAPVQSQGGRKVVVRPDEPLADGSYTVRWQVVGEDGHAVSGSFGFGVGTGPLPAEAQGSTSTPGLPAAAVLRWLVFVGLALGLGGLVGHRLVRRQLRGEAPEQTLVAPRPWLMSGCVVGAVGAFGLALHQLGGGSLLAGITGFDLDALLGSGPGRLVAYEFVGFASAAVATADPRRRLVGVGLVVALLAEAGRNHLKVEAGTTGWLLVSVHLLAAAVWVGALVHVARTAFGWRSATGAARGLFVRYAVVAAVLYAAVLASGVIGAILVLPSVAALVATTYGQVLLAKLVLVLAGSVLALAARRRLLGPARLGAGLGIAPLVRGERVALVGVLAITAVLASMPTPQPVTASDAALAYPPPVRGATLRLGALAGQVNVGIVAAPRHLEVHLQVPEADPQADQAYRVQDVQVRGEGGRAPLSLRSCGQGCFFGTPRWRDGHNVVKLAVRAPGWRGGRVAFAFDWPIRERPQLLERVRTTMAEQPRVRVVELVTSDTSRPTPPAMKFASSGKQLLSNQPYKSGRVSTVADLGRRGRGTWLAFALPAQEVYVRMLVAPDGRVLRERITSPRHLILHRFSYPDRRAPR